MNYVKCPVCDKWFVTTISYSKSGVTANSTCPHCLKYSYTKKSSGVGVKL